MIVASDGWDNNTPRRVPACSSQAASSHRVAGVAKLACNTQRVPAACRFGGWLRCRIAISYLVLPVRSFSGLCRLLLELAGIRTTLESVEANHAADTRPRKWLLELRILWCIWVLPGVLLC